ncbi:MULTISPECIES: glycosyltransferase family 9 protein [unclassified Nostoc]|uniref:glycosyltransferase family 9 protein n=1 Tax=unclassified Nostoc TaxID=2593658 RepID=UPI002AD46082|nr:MULTISPECIES: glycosyltransferase family 9 protein [unclassified Nostoc]MDZ8122897.1 glycosyltransferase family 9 protein [Nostoc sp. CmiVER01]MDZ8224098.1 glycosyltransferase family 9 protein [Nostoc sp. ChiVER01]
MARVSAFLNLGKTSLTELAGALSSARACLTVDTGTLHIAAAVGCPTVAILRNDLDGDGASPTRLWIPLQPHVKLALIDFKCTVCQEQRFKNKFCLVENHPCTVSLLPNKVIYYLQEILNL